MCIPNPSNEIIKECMVMCKRYNRFNNNFYELWEAPYDSTRHKCKCLHYFVPKFTDEWEKFLDKNPSKQKEQPYPMENHIYCYGGNGTNFLLTDHDFEADANDLDIEQLMVHNKLDFNDLYKFDENGDVIEFDWLKYIYADENVKRQRLYQLPRMHDVRKSRKPENLINEKPTGFDFTTCGELTKMDFKCGEEKMVDKDEEHSYINLSRYRWKEITDQKKAETYNDLCCEALPECCICQGPMTPNQANITTKCKHQYHLECIETWIKTKIDAEHDITCPDCRGDKDKMFPFEYKI
jgi:hypothetical protein